MVSTVSIISFLTGVRETSLDFSADGRDRRYLQYRPHFIEAANKYNLSPFLLAGIAWSESDFIPTARNSIGASGLMQLYPAIPNWQDPRANILEGARRLAQKFAEQKTTEFAIAAYNGASTYLKARKSGVNPDTIAWKPGQDPRPYIKLVLARALRIELAELVLIPRQQLQG